MSFRIHVDSLSSEIHSSVATSSQLSAAQTAVSSNQSVAPASTTNDASTSDSYTPSQNDTQMAGLYGPGTTGSNATSTRAVSVGNIGSHGNLRSMALYVLNHMLGAMTGGSAPTVTSIKHKPESHSSSSNSSTTPSSTQDAASNSSETTAAEENSGSLVMKGTVTADDGKIYNFAMNVDVATAGFVDTTQMSSSNGASISQTAAAALEMQGQFSVSFAGYANGATPSAAPNGGQDQNLNTIMNGLEGMAYDFTNSVGSADQSSSGIPPAYTPTIDPANTGTSEASPSAFSGSLTLTPQTSTTPSLDRVFNQLYHLLYDQSKAPAPATASVGSSPSGIDRHV